jgi:hypothetical protein
VKDQCSEGEFMPTEMLTWLMRLRFGAGWDFPLKWWQIPLNVILQMRLLWKMLFSNKVKAVHKARKNAGLSGPPPILQKYSVPFVLPVTQEMDYPLFIPDNLHGCGPFLLPSEPVEDVDPELAEWLQRGPLVLINRGSHLTFSDKTARRMAHGLRMLRNQRPEVRVLWKLRRENDITEATFEELQDDISKDMVRIVAWLKPDPLAILRSGKVICLVNHGGANSCLEAISSGIPQLVLPGWYDCWDWAARVDYLGIGVWGNRHAGLSLNGEELGRGFLRVCEEPKAGEQECFHTTSKESNGSAAQRSNILRVNAQRLASRAGTPGTKKVMGMILERAEATREKHSRATAQAGKSLETVDVSVAQDSA